MCPASVSGMPRGAAPSNAPGRWASRIRNASLADGVSRSVGAPGVGVVDSHECERGAAALDHVDAVLHEHLPRILHTANDGVLARVPIVIAENGDDAQGRLEIAKGANVVGDE